MTFVDETRTTFDAMAAIIADLHKRVEELEQRVSPFGAHSTLNESKMGKTFNMPRHNTVDESDRSHNVVVGACTCPFHSGL